MISQMRNPGLAASLRIPYKRPLTRVSHEIFVPIYIHNNFILDIHTVLLCIFNINIDFIVAERRSVCWAVRFMATDCVWNPCHCFAAVPFTIKLYHCGFSLQRSLHVQQARAVSPSATSQQHRHVAAVSKPLPPTSVGKELHSSHSGT